MEKGLFFVKSSSINQIFGVDIESEQAKYFYMPLKVSRVEKHQNEYPIFLYLHKDQIEIRFSGDINLDKELIIKDCSPEKEVITINFKPDIFTSIDINEQIKSLVLEEFPILEDYSLSETIKRDQTICYVNTFHNLTINLKEKKLNFATLFLDILFDFKYNSEVFKDDPNFENIKSNLIKSKLVQAILAKAEFYYQISRLSIPSYLNQSENKILSKDINLAQKDWLHLLMEDGISRVVNNKNNWFTDVETEMTKALIFEKKTIKRVKDFKIKKSIGGESKNLREQSTKWFIERNNILKAWLNKGKFEIAIYLFSLLIFLIVPLSIYANIYDKWFIDYFYIDIISDTLYGIRNIYLPMFILLGLGLFYSLYYNGFLKKIIALFNYLMIPLIALIYGATHIVFNTTTFYNKLFIKNLWTHELSGVFIITLVTILVYKILWYFVSYFSKEKSLPLFLNTLLILFIFCIFKLTLNIKLSGDSLSFFIVLIMLLFGILYYHEKESHPNLETSTSINKTLSMLFYGLVISLFVNLFYINTEYKEYIERYQYLGHIWHHTKKETDFKYIDSLDLYQKNDFEKDEEYFGKYGIKFNGIEKQTIELHPVKSDEEDIDYYYSFFYVYKPDSLSLEEGYKRIEQTGDIIDYYKHYSKVKNSIYQPLSDDVEVTIDKLFFKELENVYLYKLKEGLGNEKKYYYKESKVPIIREINLNGIKIKTIPSILFINTFISLLVAVLIQIFLHKHKFLTGGSAH